MADSQVSMEWPVPRRSLAKKVRLPALSGRASAAGLVVCFALTAVLIPMALRLPRWIAFEIVVAVWWAIWLGMLTWILYTGQRVADDHQLKEPRMWFSWDRPRQQRDPDSAWWNGFFWGWFWADDAILIVIGLFVLLGAVWFLFEIAIPLILFLLYFVARGMLAQVVNTRSHCAGRLARAFAWALLWATVYTAPVAGAVWFVHYVHDHSRHRARALTLSKPGHNLRLACAVEDNDSCIRGACFDDVTTAIAESHPRFSLPPRQGARRLRPGRSPGDRGHGSHQCV